MKPSLPAHGARPRRQYGMTLVELLVAMVIGVTVTFAISTLLIASENQKRTTTSTNDADQTGIYAFNAIDRMLRGAGSGFVESTYPSDRGVLSCRLNVASSGTAILPSTGAFPSPFNTFLGGAPSNLRVAPVLIGQNQSPDGLSDVIAVMSGSGSAGGVSRQLTGVGNSTSLVLDNVVGFATSDLVLVSQSGTTDCLLEEVSAISSPTLTIGGTYYTSSSSTTTISNLASSTSTYITPLGNAAANSTNGAVSTVQFMLLGVDANHTLYSYDLLRNQSLVQSPGTTDMAQPMTDGVYQLHAIYGIDTNGDGIQDTWAGPGDANYGITTVMASPATMKSIVSVRISLLVRGEYYDKNAVSPSTMTAFNGLANAANTSLAIPISINANDQHYRYRLFEFTVPLRNMILLAGGP